MEAPCRDIGREITGLCRRQIEQGHGRVRSQTSGVLQVGDQPIRSNLGTNIVERGRLLRSEPIPAVTAQTLVNLEKSIARLGLTQFDRTELHCLSREKSDEMRTFIPRQGDTGHCAARLDVLGVCEKPIDPVCSRLAADGVEVRSPPSTVWWQSEIVARDATIVT